MLEQLLTLKTNITVLRKPPIKSSFKTGRLKKRHLEGFRSSFDNVMSGVGAQIIHQIEALM